MIYMIVVKGAPPAELARRIAEAHAAALQSLRKRRKTKAA